MVTSFTAALVVLTAAFYAAPVHSFAPNPSIRRHSQSLTSSSLSAITRTNTVFNFRGHEIFSEITSDTTDTTANKDKPAVLLVHGFGCSTIYWRQTTKTLTEAGYVVHALDLLGQGRSDKPGRADGIEYSINLWADLVNQYAQERTTGNQEIVLMGNSLGSVVALAAATGDFSSSSDDASPAFLKQRTVGIGMFNCGIGMNSRNIIRDPQFNAFQKALFTVLFDVLDGLLFGNIAVLTYVLDKVVTQELLRNALTGLYKFAPEGVVDDVLVDSFYFPAKDPGSVEALSQIYTNDPGATPMELYEKHQSFLETTVPIHLVWGSSDQVTPLEGPVGQFFTRLADEEESNVSIEVVESGHIPFDEVPDTSNGSMLRWLKSVGSTKQTTLATGGFKIPFFAEEK